MIPILFEADATTFTNNGIGRLTDSKTCKVTEEVNGEYELKLTYPVGGKFFTEFQNERLILAIPFKGGDPQAFRIYSITDNLDGNIEVLANHISYDANYIPVYQFSAEGIGNTIAGLSSYSLVTNPFTITTDIINTETWYYQKTPKSLRACLGGEKGSVLDTFSGQGGCEFEWDNFNIKLWQNRGSDKGYEIRYAKNLAEYDRERNSEEVITGCIAYYFEEEINDEDETIPVVIRSNIQYNSLRGNYPIDKIVTIDATEDFEQTPVISELDAYALAYANAANTLDETIDVSFEDLTNEDINLCDTVKVKCTLVYKGTKVQVINFESSVIKTVWNVLEDRYDTITIGKKRSSLGDTLDNKITKASNAAAEAVNHKLISVVQYVDDEVGQAVTSINELDERVGYIDQDTGICHIINQQGSAIVQNTNAILLRTTKTEVIDLIDKNVGINLSPFFSHPLDDIYNSTDNPNGYWDGTVGGDAGGADATVTALSEGWALVQASNTTSSNKVYSFLVKKNTNITSNNLTLLSEVKDFSNSGSTDPTFTFTTYILGGTSRYAQYSGSTWKIKNSSGELVSSDSKVVNGTKYLTMSKTSYAVSNTTDLVLGLLTVPANSIISFTVRWSLYNGDYNGVYSPYTVSQADAFLYSSRKTDAAITIATDEILSEVSEVETKIIKTTGVNLSPFFSQPLDDVPNGDNLNPYWDQVSEYYTKLDDGWASLTVDNTSGSSSIYVNSHPSEDSRFTADKYTLLYELKDVTIGGSGSDPTIDFTNLEILECQYYDGTYTITEDESKLVELTKNTSGSSKQFLVKVCIIVPAGRSLTLKIRVSLYKADYIGDYLPYVIGNDYVIDNLTSVNTQINQAFSSIDQQASRITSTVDEIHRVEYDVLESAENIANEAVAASETRLNSTITQTATNLNVSISQVQTDVNNVTERLETYFDFTQDGLTIGKNTSDIRAKLDNNSLDFIDKNNVKHAWLDTEDGLGANSIALGSSTDVSKRWKIVTDSTGNFLRFTRHS